MSTKVKCRKGCVGAVTQKQCLAPIKEMSTRSFVLPKNLKIGNLTWAPHDDHIDVVEQGDRVPGDRLVSSPPCELLPFRQLAPAVAGYVVVTYPV